MHTGDQDDDPGLHRAANIHERAGKRVRHLQCRHKCAGSRLYIHYKAIDAGREFLAEDTCRNQRNRLDSGCHVAQGIDTAVCGRKVIRLSDDDGAAAFQDFYNSLGRRLRIKTGNGLQFVQSPARMPERAARDHRYGDTAGCRNRGNDQRGFVADTARAVLIDLLAGNRRKVQDPTGVAHLARQRQGLLHGHAVQINCHQPCGNVVIRDLG